MPVKVPHCSPAHWPHGLSSARFASRIRTTDPSGCRIALVGLADDLGVRLNGGRTGAAEGPYAFRAALSRYGAATPAGWEWPGVFDAGDIEPAPGADDAALAATHDRVTEAVGALLHEGLLPVGIGGGHDLTFPLVRAVVQRSRPERRPARGVYFDAHLDVRDTPGSGMAFRRLVEDCGVRALHVHGLSPMANAREHVEWFESHGGEIRSEADARETPPPLPAGPLFASLDLDVLDAAHAPGVSAMNPSGWSPGLAASWCERLGRHPSVVCFDIMELCPAHDEGGRTARLAAHLFLSFLRGFAERPA